MDFKREKGPTILAISPELPLFHGSGPRLLALTPRLWHSAEQWISIIRHSLIYIPNALSSATGGYIEIRAERVSRKRKCRSIPSNAIRRLRTFHSYFQNFHDRKFIYFPSNPISFRQTRANIAFVLLLPHRKFLMTLCRAYELMNFIDFFRQFLNRLRPTRTNAKTIIIIVALVVWRSCGIEKNSSRLPIK